MKKNLCVLYPGRGSSVGSASALYADGRGFDLHVRQHSFVEIGHEIISTAIIFLPLIQEEQLLAKEFEIIFNFVFQYFWDGKL